MCTVCAIYTAYMYTIYVHYICIHICILYNNMYTLYTTICTTAAKRIRKYQKSIMVKLYYTAKVNCIIKVSCIIDFYHYRFLIFPDPFNSCCLYINCRENHICIYFRSSTLKWDYQWLLFCVYIYIYLGRNTCLWI